MGKKYKVETIGMEELKPPHMLLSNHMHFIDFELAAMGTWPHPVSNVVSIDGYVVKWFLLERIGAIATRKFTTDNQQVKSIRKVLQRGGLLPKKLFPHNNRNALPSGRAFLMEKESK